MTIATTAAAITVEGDGATTQFDFNFIIPYQDDGVTPAGAVYYTDADSVVTQLLSNQFTWLNIGEASGGSVVYNPGGAIASGTFLTIVRTVPYNQPESFPAQAFYPQTVEDLGDLLEEQIQQVNEGLQRTVQVPLGVQMTPIDYIISLLDGTTVIPGAIGGFFATTTALLNYSFGAIASGTCAMSAARNTVGDKGGGLFYYNGADTTSVDNGGTIRVDSNNRRWYYVGQQVVPEVFGALGDGVTDDTAALTAWQVWLASVVAATPAQTGYTTVNSNYAISAPIPFYAGIMGAGSNVSKISALASFVGGYLLDFNYGAAGKILCGIELSVTALGSGGTATCIGSSSSGGGGGSSQGYSFDLVCSSNSLAVPALKANSTLTEAGMLTGWVFDALKSNGPRPLYLGNNQDDIVMNAPRFTQVAGGVGAPFVFSGTSQVLIAAFMAVSTVSAAATSIVEITNNNMLLNAFFEGTVNSDRFFLTDSASCVTIKNLQFNVTYSGVSVDQALVGVNATTTGLAKGFGITLDGFQRTGGTVAAPYTKLFSLYCTYATAQNYFTLTVRGQGYELFNAGAATFALFRTGTTVNANTTWRFYGEFGPVFGNWSAPSAAAAAPIVFSPITQPGTWS